MNKVESGVVTRLNLPNAAGLQFNQCVAQQLGYYETINLVALLLRKCYLHEL